MNFEKSKEDMHFSPRKILETDICDWCGEKKAIITDLTYVYCSENCRKMFADNAQEAIKNNLESRSK